MNTVSRSRYTSPTHAAARFAAQRGLLKPLVWRLTRVTVLGREHLDNLATGPFVVAGNHASHLDAPLIMGAMPWRHGRYLAAAAAADYFFDVWWRKGLTALFFNAFPVDRRGTRVYGGLSTTLLDAGVPLLVFPEGTRSATGEMATFKSGTAALCISHQVPCVPVAVVGANVAMPRGRSWVIPGRPPVAVVFGEPMVPAPDDKAREFTERLEKEVRTLYDQGSTYLATHGAGRPGHEEGRP